MLEKIQGVVLKTRDYGETHKIITIFSKKLGKLSAIAKGAKKPKSRMAAVTQPFIYAEFLMYVNKGLSTIQQAEVIDSFRSIREDIVKTAYAAYLVELTDKLMDDKKPDVFIFEQFFQTMQWINKEEDAQIPLMMFELKLYQKGGFAPTVACCSHCKTTTPPFAFSIQEAGLLCSSCRSMDSQAIDLPKGVAKLLSIFASVELQQVTSISVKESNKRLLRELLDHYYDYYGGYYLKSRKFLQQLDLLK
ncbi:MULTISPECIES: DNA repair protein RecO [Clostridia]|uniref:DNA repair protein RecO n=1 Tax=Clostridia TaxID=186801 RepID=UPI000EA11301|nr:MULTISPECIES: DNA repair protein RecO [Clostridia]NBJ68551.1 DNA repair protein RecO [Roseburia sp. 1XD42-34]RKI80761.1 DNA repair protein RecO [Clostridium sp. 1xD42-85]